MVSSPLLVSNLGRRGSRRAGRRPSMGMTRSPLPLVRRESRILAAGMSAVMVRMASTRHHRYAQVHQTDGPPIDFLSSEILQGTAV